MPDPTPAGPARPADLPSHCLNCASPLGEPRPRYCPQCGQETNLKPPTMLEFAQHLGGSVLATEGALWRTLRLLLRPGALTAEYLRGRRRHYVLPLRLYLTVSLVALLLLRLTTTANVTARVPDALQASAPSVVVVDIGARRAGLDHGRFYCEQLPDWLCQRLERRLDLAPKAVQRELQALPERFVGHWGTAMFLLVPLFALLLKGLYLNRGLRYTEHLVFALHLHAFWFLAGGLAAVPVPPLRLLLLPAMPVYAFMAARRVYGGRRWATALRGLAISLAYGGVLMVAMVAVLAWAFIS